jgi:archaellum component FlaC
MVESSSAFGSAGMSEERFDRIDAALTGLSGAVSGLNARVTGLDAKVTGLAGAVAKLTVLHEETRGHVRVIAEGFVVTNERIDSVDKRLGSMDKRLDSVDHRLLRIETSLTNHDTRISAVKKRPRSR